MKKQKTKSSTDAWRSDRVRAWGPANWSLGDVSPNLEVYEDRKGFRVTLELPGVDAKDIELALSNNTLSVWGEKKPSAKERKGNFYVLERAYGSFCRSVPLPRSVNEDQVTAHFRDGILTITLPKRTTGKTEGKRITLSKE